FPFGSTSSPRSFNTPCEVLPLTKVKSLSTNISLSCWNFTSYSNSSLERSSLSSERFLLSFTDLENNFLSITTPLKEGEAFKDASFTSPTLSPNMARNNFSSGVGSDSPFGVILPIRISPGLTSAPIRIIPYSSKSFVASSETFGISLVNSSAPNLVSLTSKAYSSTWMDVKISSRTTFSEITIASSKLYPFHGINATTKFLPRANSPFSVAYPSQSTCPFLTLYPFLTIGLRLILVPWFVFLNLTNSYVLESSSKLTNLCSSVRSYLMVIFWESTYSMTPSPSALINTLESEATCRSRPVPTIGASGFNKGTACRIMLDPISALLASSCSKNGIRDADMEAIWLGATSV